MKFKPARTVVTDQKSVRKPIGEMTGKKKKPKKPKTAKTVLKIKT